MVSQKQMAANRQNALKSTGPRTAAGKARSSMNAVTHGLLSRKSVLADDDAELFEAFRSELVAQLMPEGEMECLLADRIVAAAWRLRRVVGLEADLMQDDSDDAEANGSRFGRVAFRHCGHAEKYLMLGRYEAHIERGMYKALRELERLQASRPGETNGTAG